MLIPQAVNRDRSLRFVVVLLLVTEVGCNHDGAGGDAAAGAGGGGSGGAAGSGGKDGGTAGRGSGGESARGDGGGGAVGGGGGGGGAGGGGCDGPTPICTGMESGVCLNDGLPAICVSNHWSCQTGLVPISTCTCFGFRPPSSTASTQAPDPTPIGSTRPTQLRVTERSASPLPSTVTSLAWCHRRHKRVEIAQACGPSESRSSSSRVVAAADDRHGATH
jgi:hypothetical protein